MSGFVVDASVATSWLFHDQASPGTDDLLRRVPKERAVVPELWYLEVTNVIAIAERKRLVRSTEIPERLALIALLPVQVEHVPHGDVLSVVLPLARNENLTSYDAIYLHLAIKLGLSIATRDAALVRAARRHRVAVLP